MTYEQIANIIVENDFKQWKIYKTTKSQPMLQFENNPDINRDLELQRMARVMEHVFGESFMLKGNKSDSKQAGQGWFEIEFTKLNPGMPYGTVAGIGSMPFYQQYQQQPAVVNGITQEELQKQLDLVRREVKMDMYEEEYKDFLKKKAQWEQEQATGLNYIWSHVGKVLPQIFPNAFPQTVGVHGQIAGLDENGHIPANNLNTNNMQEIDLDKLLTEWIQHDADAPQLLAKIVHISKTNPGMYNMAKTMLLSQP